MDALRQLADRAGIELHEDANAGPRVRNVKRRMAAMERAVTWYHERLLTSPDARPARDYLRSRGIDGDVARQFKLGWAPDEWDALRRSLKLNEKVLARRDSALSTSATAARTRCARGSSFRSSIPRARPSRWGDGSADVGDDRDPMDASKPKYKNSPETPIYSKRRTLYALNFAKDDIIKSGEIIVCEGYTDVIAFFTRRAAARRRDVRHRTRRRALSPHAQLRQADRPRLRRRRRRPERRRLGLSVGAPARG